LNSLNIHEIVKLLMESYYDYEIFCLLRWRRGIMQSKNVAVQFENVWSRCYMNRFALSPETWDLMALQMAQFLYVCGIEKPAILIIQNVFPSLTNPQSGLRLNLKKCCSFMKKKRRKHSKYWKLSA